MSTIKHLFFSTQSLLFSSRWLMLFSQLGHLTFFFPFSPCCLWWTSYSTFAISSLIIIHVAPTPPQSTWTYTRTLFVHEPRRPAAWEIQQPSVQLFLNPYSLSAVCWTGYISVPHLLPYRCKPTQIKAGTWHFNFKLSCSTEPEERPSKFLQSGLYFLQKATCKWMLAALILTTLYWGSGERDLSSCIIIWCGNCNAADGTTLGKISEDSRENHQRESSSRPAHGLFVLSADREPM